MVRSYAAMLYRQIQDSERLKKGEPQCPIPRTRRP